jgi:hypothetical protein
MAVRTLAWLTMRPRRKAAMKKRDVKKLTLNKETLERLDDQTLTRFGVRGLGESPSDSVPQCCGGTD